MATRKTPAKKTAATKPATTQPVARKATARKTTAQKATARKATAQKATAQKARRRRRTTTRRPQPALSTTIGGALGALVVTTLLDLSWPVRIALIVVVLLVGLGYLLWKNRRAIAVEAAAATVAATAVGERPTTPPADGPPTDQP